MIQTIMLDFGHEETVKGKISPDGTFREWEFNRMLGGRIYEKLKTLGLDVRLINPETSYVSLTERAERANKVCKEVGTSNVMFVSIHANAAGNGGWMSARGWCVFCAKQCSQASKDLATKIANVAEEAGFKVRKPTAAQNYWQENFTVLTKTNCKAILTENLFYDNKEDLALLRDEETIEKLVNVHVKGICNYLGISDVPSYPSSPETSTPSTCQCECKCK